VAKKVDENKTSVGVYW